MDTGLYNTLSLILGSCALCVSTLGFTVVIASLIFLSRQTHEAAKSNESGAYSNIANHMFEIDQVFINHPNLRPYFYEGAEIKPEASDYQQVLAVAETILDFFDAILVQKPYLKKLWQGNWWDTYIEDGFRNSPVLCRRIDSGKNWYSDELYAYRTKAPH